MTKIQFPFSKVSASAYESVQLGECVNAEFNWEVKTGIGKKRPFSGAVRLRESFLSGHQRNRDDLHLRECPLTGMRK